MLRRKELANGADAENDRQQHRGDARGEERSRDRKLFPAALHSSSDEGRQEQDDAAWGEERQNPTEEGGDQRAGIFEGVHFKARAFSQLRRAPSESRP